MKHTKEDAIKVVTVCAEKYEAELENRNLLFFCIDKHKRVSYIEFSFHDYNFMHLTGLKPLHKATLNADEDNERLSAADFYRRCLNKKLSAEDFYFSADGTTFMKLEVLPFIISKNLSANMIGNFNSQRPKLYTEKIAGSTKAYIGFVKEDTAGEYVPNTVVKGDLRANVTDYVRVASVYRKRFSDDKYSECVYVASKVDWSRIEYPERFSYLPKPVMNDENAVLTTV